jgi:isopentenyl-diphosphate delta-isomerase
MTDFYVMAKPVVPQTKRQVVLVDEQDRNLGLMEIVEAHKGTGRLHRAISVLISNSKGELLLQKRSGKKLLWPGFWTNTVCTHPLPNEEYLTCAERRLGEEMGINFRTQESASNTSGAGVRSQDELKIVHRFRYQAQYDNNYSEHELDTVIVGKYDGEVRVNPEEASDFRWISREDLKKEMDKENYFTPWFRLIMASGRV